MWRHLFRSGISTLFHCAAGIPDTFKGAISAGAEVLPSFLQNASPRNWLRRHQERTRVFRESFVESLLIPKSVSGVCDVAVSSTGCDDIRTDSHGDGSAVSRGLVKDFTALIAVLKMCETVTT